MVIAPWARSASPSNPSRTNFGIEPHLGASKSSHHRTIASQATHHDRRRRSFGGSPWRRSRTRNPRARSGLRIIRNRGRADAGGGSARRGAYRGYPRPRAHGADLDDRALAIVNAPSSSHLAKRSA